ncbi:MAG: hypothetical protein LKE29_04585 [Acidaminococcaceae bacterium]|nr:hypothetical protein [Acidaminococcaceae bacterium]
MESTKPLSPEALKTILAMQRNEVTEYNIYNKIANRVKDEKNRKTLRNIGSEELRHSEIWKTYTGINVKPDSMKIIWYNFLSIVFGYTFALKLMESGENNAVHIYESLEKEVPKPKRFLKTRILMNKPCLGYWMKNGSST